MTCVVPFGVSLDEFVDKLSRTTRTCPFLGPYSGQILEGLADVAST
jgi:hypothetical protein